MKHLDDLLAIEAIDIIQWQPGAGKPGPLCWIELYRKIQQAEKGLQIRCTPEEVRALHKELRPEKVLYVVEASSEREAEGLLDWLEDNT